jgi:hypothetical protein
MNYLFEQRRRRRRKYRSPSTSDRISDDIEQDIIDRYEKKNLLIQNKYS